MEKDLTNEERSKILTHYLGTFAIYFTDDEEKLFKENLKNLDNSVIRASDYKLLKKAICYVLLSLGKRVKYLYLKTNDILDAMLNDDFDSEDYNYWDIQNIPLLIIYHPKLWKKNKIMWETLNYMLDTRLKEGKKTIIITDSNRLYDEHGSLDASNIIDLDNTNTYTINTVPTYTHSSNDIYS